MAGKQDTGSEFQSKAVGRNWTGTARYLLWVQIQYKDVNEQRNELVKILVTFYFKHLAGTVSWAFFQAFSYSSSIHRIEVAFFTKLLTSFQLKIVKDMM